MKPSRSTLAVTVLAILQLVNAPASQAADAAPNSSASNGDGASVPTAQVSGGKSKSLASTSVASDVKAMSEEPGAEPRILRGNGQVIAP